jgi:heme oxygenase
MSAIALLRSETAASHEAVDSIFGTHDLGDAAAYGRFLQAHARALPQAEAMAVSVWPALRRRTPLLAADLDALGLPAELAVDSGGEGTPAHWGALYVVEGSRLGGGLLAKRVGQGLPVAYLSAVHEPGEWRAMRQAIDRAADGQDKGWLEEMVAGAQATFALYAAAARDERAV